MKQECQSNKVKSKMEKKKWLPEEDQLLLKTIESYINMKIKLDWQKIAQSLRPNFSRVGKQCRERYVNHLKPEVNKGKWSLSEDESLLIAHQKIGNAWSKMTKLLPGRTDHALKNRFNYLKRKNRVKAVTLLKFVLKTEMKDLIVSSTKNVPEKKKELDLENTHSSLYFNRHDPLTVIDDSEMNVGNLDQFEDCVYDYYVTTTAANTEVTSSIKSQDTTCILSSIKQDHTISNHKKIIQSESLALDLADALSFIDDEFPSRTIYCNNSEGKKCFSPIVFTPLSSPSKNILTFPLTNLHIKRI